MKGAAGLSIPRGRTNDCTNRRQRSRSAALSPRLGPIAMGYVDRGAAEAGTKLEIDAGSATIGASVAGLPFYKAPKR